MNEVKIKGWVARDEDGNLYLHQYKPTRNLKYECWESIPETLEMELMEESIFSELSWEDEPLEVEITIKAI